MPSGSEASPRRACAPAIALTALLLAVVPGCEGVPLPRRVTSLGPVSRYPSLLELGGGIKVYSHDGRRLPPGSLIVLDSVSVWRSIDAPSAEIAPEELNGAAYLLRDTVGEELERNHRIVRRPGPGVLTARLAIVEEAETWMVFEDLGTVRPPAGRLADEEAVGAALAKLLSTASLTIIVTDSQTRLDTLAAAEARFLEGEADGAELTWGGLRAAFRAWAGRLRERVQADVEPAPRASPSSPGGASEGRSPP